jgi:very-short-patch-repair endonuclease
MAGRRTTRARKLRADSTYAEDKLWARLKGRSLGGFKFRRQVPIGRFFADFACHEAMLVVEIDGDHHAEQQDYDENRTAVLQTFGYEVVRFASNDVLFGSRSVTERILERLLAARTDVEGP